MTGWGPRAVPPRRQREISRWAITILFVATLAGRISLERVGLVVADVTDVRVWGCAAALIAAFGWRLGPGREDWRGYRPSSVTWMFVLLGLLALAAFWALPGARLQIRLTDLAALAALLIAAVLVSRSDSVHAARWMLMLMLLTGLVYAVAAFAAGGGAQDRYSAFGGGPNVFVRIVGMGAVAACALMTTVVSRRRRLALLASLPVLATAVFLSGSRGGLLALTAAVLIFLPAFAKGRLTLSRLLGCVLGAIVLAVAVWQFGAQRAARVAERFGSSGLEAGDYSGRPQLLARCWDIFMTAPLTGGGMDGFWTHAGWAMGFDYPHNFVAAVAVDTGAIGLAVMALTAAAWWFDGRPWAGMPVERLACATVAVFIGLESLVSGDYYDSRWMWLLAIFAVNRATPRDRSDRHLDAAGSSRGARVTF